MTLIERFAAARSQGTFDSWLAEIPYAKWLGLAAHEVGAELIITMTFAPHLIGNARLPALHGGALGALLESAAFFELLWRSETVVLPKTITLTIDYLRSAGPRDTHAACVITRRGRRVTNVRCEAWQEDRTQPVASANAILLVIAPGG